VKRMTREQAYVLLTDIFRDEFEDDSILLGEGTTTADIAGWDSVAEINILAAAEVRFGIEIRAAEAERLASVGDLVDLILRKVPRVRVA
jgi:acyl carrier protein